MPKGMTQNLQRHDQRRILILRQQPLTSTNAFGRLAVAGLPGLRAIRNVMRRGEWRLGAMALSTAMASIRTDNRSCTAGALRDRRRHRKEERIRRW